MRDILNGKSWENAMRVFWSVAAALLQQFLSTGQKTYGIEQYLETFHIPPTGPHWVNNFLLPKLLIYQFERPEQEGEVPLKQLTMRRMIKYFFHAGHVQYARYIT